MHVVNKNSEKEFYKEIAKCIKELEVEMDRSGPVRSRSQKTGLLAWTGLDRSIRRS